ncbi:putative exported protein [Psychrobacter sp. JCM 18900]|nr:putative exported protein [Psychrobacter sp. JCM 18900]
MSGTHEVQATSNNTAPVTSKNGVLVDATNHMTLYTFDKDSMNKSDCGAACQVVWPIFKAPSDAKASGQFAAFKREDGKYQWAMNGKLYTSMLMTQKLVTKTVMINLAFGTLSQVNSRC